MTDSAPGAGPRPRPRLLANVALLLGVLTLFAALGELLVRGFGGIRYGGWGDPASIRLVSKQFVHNSRGLRDEEVPPGRPAAEFRILCLGDSFTWGQMVERTDAYPEVLEREIAPRMGPGTSCRVINAGQLGWNTEDEAKWFVSEARRYDPSVVLVGFFLNDPETGHYELARLLPAPVERLLGGSYFFFFLKYRVHMLRVRFGLTPSYESYLESLYRPDSQGWWRCRNALAAIGETAAGRGAPVLVLIFPVVSPWESYRFAPLHAAVVSACDSLGLASVDLLDAFRASPLPWTALRVGPNDEHPSAAGHRIIAGAAFAALEARHLIPGAP